MCQILMTYLLHSHQHQKLKEYHHHRLLCQAHQNPHLEHQLRKVLVLVMVMQCNMVLHQMYSLDLEHLKQQLLFRILKMDLEHM